MTLSHWNSPTSLRRGSKKLLDRLTRWKKRSLGIKKQRNAGLGPQPQNAGGVHSLCVWELKRANQNSRERCHSLLGVLTVKSAGGGGENWCRWEYRGGRRVALRSRTKTDRNEVRSWRTIKWGYPSMPINKSLGTAQAPTRGKPPDWRKQFQCPASGIPNLLTQGDAQEKKVRRPESFEVTENFRKAAINDCVGAAGHRGHDVSRQKNQ